MKNIALSLRVSLLLLLFSLLFAKAQTIRDLQDQIDIIKAQMKDMKEESLNKERNIEKLEQEKNEIKQKLEKNNEIRETIDDLKKSLYKLEKEVENLQQQQVPIGAIIAYWGPLDKIPSGFLLCDGREITSSPLLQGIEGRLFTPDLSNKFLMGLKEASFPKISIGGNPSIEIPSHRHTGSMGHIKGESDASSAFGDSKTSDGYNGSCQGKSGRVAGCNHIHDLVIAESSSIVVPLIPPYVGVVYIIRIK